MQGSAIGGDQRNIAIKWPDPAMLQLPLQALFPHGSAKDTSALGHL